MLFIDFIQFHTLFEERCEIVTTISSWSLFPSFPSIFVFITLMTQFPFFYLFIDYNYYLFSPIKCRLLQNIALITQFHFLSVYLFIAYFFLQ